MIVPFVLVFFDNLTRLIFNTDYHCRFRALLRTNETFMTQSPLEIYAYECDIYSPPGAITGKGMTAYEAFYNALKEAKK